MRAAEGAIDAGTVLAGKYRVEAVLGRGGMGMVYRARHLALGEDVAIKILRSDVSLDEETRARFLREAQSAVKIKSEHVARVLDVGTSDDGLPFMVMEFLQGADLGQMVDTHGAMSIPVAVDLVLQACDAIVEAHSIGTVHRDVKPSNLFVSFRPDQSTIVKVLDFGISKSASGPDMSLTQTQSMLGTPAYMSPEQMRSARSVDVRTDIWSLGTVLYELVEARRPFEAASFSEMCVMVAVDPPARMILAPQIEGVIARCLEKNPADRYPHVAELMRDLAPFAGNPETANQYVKRAYRTLGLGVPSRLESSPSITRGSYPVIPGLTPSAVHGAASAAPSSATPFPLAPPAPALPDPPRARSSGRWFAVVGLVALLGAGGALAVVKLSGGSGGAATSGAGEAASGPDGANANGANANGANASDGANPGGANAGGANAGGANPGGANAGGANADGANPGGANAGGPNPGGTNAGGANADGANPGGANAGGANAGGANAGGANAGGANPGGANPGGANAGGTNADGANPGGAHATGANANGAGTNANGTNSANANGAGTNSAGTNSAGTNSAGTNANGSNSAGSNANANGTGAHTAIATTTTGKPSGTAKPKGKPGTRGTKPPVTKLPGTPPTTTTTTAPTTTTTTTTTTAPTTTTTPKAKPCGVGGDPFAAPRPCKP